MTPSGRRGAVLLLCAVALAACRPPPTPETPEPSPEPSPEPRVATFRTTLNLLRISGVTCRGLRGPWRVKVSAPSPIEGSARSRFRLPPGNGAGRLRWSFEARHPGQGLVTYAGDVRVRVTGPPEAPALVFAGDQTAVGITSKVLGRARLNLGGACPG